MLYFAELAGKKVVTPEGIKIGILVDLLFLGSGQPLVTKMVVKTGYGRHIIPISNTKTINGTIVVPLEYQRAVMEDNELSLNTHLMDQQIIDIKGNKVIRVNDVAIQEKPYYIIAGVDVGLLGIARWMHIEQFLNKFILSLFGTAMTSNFLPWDDIQPVELSRGKVVLKREETKLTRLAPEDLADHLERLSVKNLSKILDLLPTEYEAEVIANLNLSRQHVLFRSLKPSRAARILSKADPDEAVDILLTLSDKRKDAIIKELDEETKANIDTLMPLTKTDLGNLATNEFFTADPEETCANVKMRLKQSADFSGLYYIYVINKKSELIGVCNLHELLLQSNDMPVYKFMAPNVVTISLTTPPTLALKKMIKFKFFALPIINEKRQMIGLVTIDDLVESIHPNL